MDRLFKSSSWVLMMPRLQLVTTGIFRTFQYWKILAPKMHRKGMYSPDTGMTEIKCKTSKRNLELEKWKLIITLNASYRYHAHQYTNGTVCDLTNQPRETEVRSFWIPLRFHCLFFFSPYACLFFLFRWGLSAQNPELWLVLLLSYPLASMHSQFNAQCFASIRKSLFLLMFNQVDFMKVKSRCIVSIYQKHFHGFSLR